MVELFANSGDPDHTQRSVASDLGLHCLSITLLGISRLQWFTFSNCFTKFRKIFFLIEINVSSKQNSYMPREEGIQKQRLNILANLFFFFFFFFFF